MKFQKVLSFYVSMTMSIIKIRMQCWSTDNYKIFIKDSFQINHLLKFKLYSGERNVVIPNIAVFFNFWPTLSKINKKNPLGRQNVVVFRPPLYDIF